MVSRDFYNSLVLRIKIEAGIYVGDTGHQERLNGAYSLNINERQLTVEVTVLGGQSTDVSGALFHERVELAFPANRAGGAGARME